MRFLVFFILVFYNLPAQDSLAIYPKNNDSSEDQFIFNDTIKYDVKDLNLYETKINGRVMTAMVTESGDTLIMEQLEDISITSLRSFKNEADYRKYMKFRRYAAIVYPYAKEAIKIFRETEYVTKTMKKRREKSILKSCRKI